MRNRDLITSLLFIVTTNFICAQSKWEPGYLVGNNEDTIYAQILSARNSIWDVKVLLDNGQKAKLSANEINRYFFGSTTYKSLMKSSGSYFFRQITFGRINIYEQKGHYYIADEQVAVGLSRSNYRKELNKRYKEYSEFLDEVDKVDRNLQEVIDIAKKYNEKFIQQETDKNLNKTKKTQFIENKLCLSLNEDSILKELKPAFFKVGFDGISFETKISSSTTMFIGAGANFSFYKEFGRAKTSATVTPIVVGQPRIYLNLRKRMRLNKSIERFSGDYLAPSAVYIGPPYDLMGGGLILGTQRFFTERTYIGFSGGFGMGKSIIDGKANAEPIVIYGFKFGFSPKSKK